MSQRLTLTAVDRFLAVSSAPDRSEKIRQILAAPQLDWVSVMAWANAHLVAPALWTALSEPSLRDLVPDDAQRYLEMLHTRNAARNARIWQQCRELGAILAKGGTRATLLKGAAWLTEAGPAASDRMMGDIDIAVAADDLERVVQCLREAGYRTAPGLVIEEGHIHHPPLFCDGAEALVEVHRDLANRIELLPTAELMAAAQPVAPGLALPHVRHRIAHNVIHSQIMNGDFVGGVVNLRDGLDLARLITGCEAGFDWLRLREDARERGYLRELSGAIHCVHRLFGSALPRAFADDMRGRLHAWRCLQQRRWPLASGAFKRVGVLTRALAWERDAYALGVAANHSWRARLLVGRRRARRALAAVRRRMS